MNNQNSNIIDIETLLTCGGSFKKIANDEIIFHEGESSQYYYQLVSGSIRGVNINESGREFLQLIISPGESFGELPLFDGGDFAASAIANEDSVIIRLRRPLFIALIEDNIKIYSTFSKLLTERLRFKFFLLKEIANHNPEHSISELLAYFKNNHKNICTRCNRIKLTRQQIADMTGFRVETVIRSIKKLESKGKLSIEKGKVYC